MIYKGSNAALLSCNPKNNIENKQKYWIYKTLYLIFFDLDFLNCMGDMQLKSESLALKLIPIIKNNVYKKNYL